MLTARYLILLGAPGAGKGTQASYLSRWLSLPHVASGDLFREALSTGTELGLLAREYMERGELVPDEIAIKLVLERLAQPDCANGAILDGFPRTLERARELDRALGEQGKGIERALYINVSKQELLERLSGRRICKLCQTPYHVKYNPPKVPGRCDRDGGELYQRADDSIETTSNRYAIYFEQTAPLIDYYRDQKKLREVDGECSIEQVGANLVAAVN